MKSLIFLFLTTLTAAAQTAEVATSKELQKWIRTEKEMNRAKTNDHVLLVVLTIKPTAKPAFDSWVKDILYKALYQSKSEMKKAQLKVTRWLEPVHQNTDSTWTYSWIMDPVIPNTDYDILTFLKNEYGNETGEKHWQTYLTFMAREPIIVGLKQTSY